MSEAVTDVIVSRSREPQGLTSMLAWSTAVHVVAFAALWMAPRPDVTEPERVVMTISLGAAGPQTSGMTDLGGREVQAVRPPDNVRRPENAPAPRREEMTLPTPRPRPDTRPQRSNVESSTSRAPSLGEEITDGNTRANTRQRGQGFGLSGGGAVAGSGVRTDVMDFCCPTYLETLVTAVKRGWEDNQGRIASTTIKFTIARDGTVRAPQVEIASGFADLDSLALRAVQLAQLPPLPGEFTNPTLTVHLRFDYQR
jgi:TonB family protein